MQDKKIEWGKEIVQAGSDVATLAKDVGIPGIGLLAKFAQRFYDKHLQKRFEKFLADAEVGEEMINKISADENYSKRFLCGTGDCSPNSLANRCHCTGSYL